MEIPKKQPRIARNSTVPWLFQRGDTGRAHTPTAGPGLREPMLNIIYTFHIHLHTRQPPECHKSFHI